VANDNQNSDKNNTNKQVANEIIMVIRIMLISRW
jgi:hypothetical protein